MTSLSKPVDIFAGMLPSQRQTDDVTSEHTLHVMSAPSSRATSPRSSAAASGAQMTFHERLDCLSRYTKQLMECTSLKHFFTAFRHCLRQVFNFQQLYLMLKNEDLAIMYRKKEFVLTHTLNIDNGKSYTLTY